MKEKQHYKFLNKLTELKLLNNEVFYTYINNKNLRNFILDYKYLNEYLTNPFNKESGKILNYYIEKNIININLLKEFFEYKIKTNQLEDIQDIKHVKKLKIEDIKYEYFLFCKNFTKTQITNFHNKNKNIINNKLIKICNIIDNKNSKINLKKKEDFLLQEYNIIFYYYSLITQKEFYKLDEELKEEIFEWYKKIYKLILNNFITRGEFLFSILKKMINIFYNFHEELYDEIEEYQDEIIEINQELNEYKVIDKLNKLVKFYKFYNKFVVEEETLEDIIKEDLYYIYLIDLKYIEVEQILDLIEELLLFSNQEEKYNYYISKLFLLFNKFDLNRIFLNDIKQQKKYHYILFNELIIELIDTKTKEIKEEFKYPVLKLLQKYEFNIEENNDKILIDIIFEIFNKKNFQNLSPYYVNYIYLYIKNNYKNHYKKKLKEIIKKHNLIAKFLESKYLFEEKELIKNIIKELKEQKRLVGVKLKEHYLRNPYFDLTKQAEFFQVLPRKEQKIYLENNPNINLLLLKINQKNFDFVINNNKFIENLIFNRLDNNF